MSAGSGGVEAGLAGAERSTADPVGLQDHVAFRARLGPLTTTITRPRYSSENSSPFDDPWVLRYRPASGRMSGCARGN